ncbi:hypothetical protein [Nocardioides sp. SYSU D00065]|uniref:hypothetical protein n=1 Tax=Nocardioides sp. SYSU D00065 TaxID=2817378 RepID=UPI001B323F25|nr:hypothetical protein [Nocardioides sp. SYSU D00065]
MGELNRTGGLPLVADYTRFVRRHRARIAAAVAAGVLGGLALSATQSTTYSATASVALTPVPLYVMAATSELAPPPVSIDTDAQLLRSPAVLAAVAEELDVDGARSEEHMSVTASPNTSILHVTVTATDAAAAARAADAAALALLEVRRTALGAITNEQIRQLRFHVVATEAALARQQARRLVVPARDDLFAELLELRTRLDELESARRTPAEVIEPAPDRGQAVYANSEVPVTSGAALGLVIGCLVGAARDRSRDEHSVPKEDEHAA